MSPATASEPRGLAIARRYEPAMIAVFVILIALLVAPRPDRGSRTEALATPLPTSAPQAAVVSELGAVPPEEPEGPVELARPPATVPAAPAVAVDATPRQPTGPAPTTTTTTSVPQRPVPLRVVEAGWAGSDVGFPVSSDVPEGTLPVSVTLGEPDRRSFLRFAGTETVLELETRSDQPGTRFPDAAVIWLCPVTEAGWTAEVDMAEPPRFDCTRHATGDAGDGRWSFDIAGLGSPERREGFVLVAADEASDFQILFVDPTAP